MAALALASATCTGGNGAGGVALSSYEAELRAAVCHYQVLCNDMPDQATCLSSTHVEENLSFWTTMQADVAAGRVAYDAKAARACADGFNSLQSCTQTEIVPLLQRLQAICDAVFSGTVAPDGACFFHEECTGRDVCSRTMCTPSACCQGTCLATPPPIPAGGDCSNMPQGWSCAAGTSCAPDPQTLARVCTPDLAGGADCTSTTAACADPYLCRAVPPGDHLVCTAPVERGQTCGDAGDVFRCNDFRDNCDPQNHVCIASVPVGGDCSVAGGCIGYAACVDGICVARGRPGDACASTGDCLGDLVCDATLRCSLPSPGPSCR